MTSNKRKSLALAVLMVLSTVAIAGSGLAAEVPRGGDDPTFDPGVGGGNDVVVSENRTVVFRGEDGFQFVDVNGNPVDPSSLIGVSGDAEGIPLESPIPEDQVLGQYTRNGQPDTPGVTVQQPRVTDIEVFNRRGADVADSSVPEDEILLVRGEYNYPAAEDLSIEVTDENGNDITGDVLTTEEALSEQQLEELSGLFAEFPSQVGNPGQRGTGTDVEWLQGFGQFSDEQVDQAPNATIDAGYWALDLGDQNAGTYTVTVEGWDNLDFGQATDTATIELTTETDITLDVGADEATRGQYVPFTIRGSNAGAMHYVTIEDDDFRNDQVDERVFRAVENILERGTFDEDDDGEAEFAYAQIIVDEDTGLGEGQLDTTYLDDTNVDVNLYDEELTIEDVADTFRDPEDDRSLRVLEGELAIEEPVGTYVAGAEVDTSGTAQPGIDDVALYARDQGDWELLDINTDGEFDRDDLISVDADGEWEERDVVLSDASDILAIPGRYRFGVIESEDVIDAEGTLQETLTTSEFSSATSQQTSILVVEPGLGPANETNASDVAGPVGSVDALPAGAAASVGDAPAGLLDAAALQQGNETAGNETAGENETAAGDEVTPENETTDDDAPEDEPAQVDDTAQENETTEGVTVEDEDRPNVFLYYNGQVATDDGTLDVIGVAPGLDEVLAVMVDTRGRVATDVITTDDDDVFEEDDVPLVTQENRDLNEGQVVAFVIGLGRDGVAGDGELPGQDDADIGSLENYIQGLSGQGLTQQQVTDRIADETVEDAGSDDLFVGDEFRYTDGSTTIETVRPVDPNETGENVSTGIGDVRPGDEMLVRGLTNRKPDDNTISVDVTEGPSAAEFPADSTDEWGFDGRWAVTIEVPEDVEPGTYTVESDDGDNTDIETFEVVAADDEAEPEAEDEDGISVTNVTVEGNVTEEPEEEETVGVDENETAGNETIGMNETADNETVEGENETAG